MELVEAIKKQNELEDEITKLQDESEEVGEIIQRHYEDMTHEERVEHYDSLPCCSTKFDIFRKYFYPIIEAKQGGR